MVILSSHEKWHRPGSQPGWFASIKMWSYVKGDYYVQFQAPYFKGQSLIGIDSLDTGHPPEHRVRG